MKKLFLAAALTLPLIAVAQADNGPLCVSIAEVAKSTAKMRDQGISAVDIMAEIRKGGTDHPIRNLALKITERVYYDPEIRRLTPNETADLYYNICVSGGHK